MKFKFEVECTADEARQCLGLPNVAPVQERMLNLIEARMQENISRFDPETLVKTWLPNPIQGWGELQKVFWGQMGSKPSSKEE